MDYYDSTYPLDYYKVGEKYLFYRDTTNRNYWLPQTPEEQDIYNAYVSKYLDLLNTSASKQTRTTSNGITEVITSTVGITETANSSNMKGVTEDKSQKNGRFSNNTQIESDKEGALINYPGINREIGIVVGKYNGPTYKLLTVLFDDGKVLDYILGTPALFDQKNYKVYTPKLKVDVPPLDKKQIPLSIQELARADGKVWDISVKRLSTSETSGKKKEVSGITEQETEKEKIGITENKKENAPGITEQKIDEE